MSNETPTQQMENLSRNKLESALLEARKEFKEVQINEEPLISSDFSGNPSASIINSNFTQINDDIITMMIWYDNEFGYSSQYVKSIEKIIKKEKNV